MPRVTRPEWDRSIGDIVSRYKGRQGHSPSQIEWCANKFAAEIPNMLKDILQLESDLREKDKAIVRAIRALRFADTPEARMISFTPLAVELKAALTSTAEAEGKKTD